MMETGTIMVTGGAGSLARTSATTYSHRVTASSAWTTHAEALAMAYRRREGIDTRIARIFKTYARACARMMARGTHSKACGDGSNPRHGEPGRPAAPA
jgi:hypothetical protein